MSMTIQDLNGNEVHVFAKMDRGNLWCMLRAPDEATFNAVGLSVGLLEYENPGAPAVIDPETQEVLVPAVEPSGRILGLMADGERITVARLGPMVITPGTYDEDGNELTAPVLDTRFHVNFWLPPGMVSRGLWKKWAIAWSQQGSVVTDKNASEDALALNGIELIDPDTIATPSNALAGSEHV